VSHKATLVEQPDISFERRGHVVHLTTPGKSHQLEGVYDDLEVLCLLAQLGLYSHRGLPYVEYIMPLEGSRDWIGRVSGCL
jgi:hypothetical protein